MEEKKEVKLLTERVKVLEQSVDEMKKVVESIHKQLHAHQSSPNHAYVY